MSMNLALRLARLSALFAPAPLPPPQPVFTRRARGVALHGNPRVRRIVVSIDEATFERIGAAADSGGVSVTEAIRQLIARGLECNPLPNRKA